MTDTKSIYNDYIKQQIEVKEAELTANNNAIEELKVKNLEIETILDGLVKQIGENRLAEKTFESFPKIEGENTNIVYKVLDSNARDGNGLLIREIEEIALNSFGISVNYRFIESTLEDLIEAGGVIQTNIGYTRNKRFGIPLSTSS